MTTGATRQLPLYEGLAVAVATIQSHAGARRPTVGLVLGSGLGGFADQLQDPVIIDYHDIPHFPVSTVSGHAGRLVIGRMGDVCVAAMQGARAFLRRARPQDRDLPHPHAGHRARRQDADHHQARPAVSTPAYTAGDLVLINDPHRTSRRRVRCAARTTSGSGRAFPT